MGIDFTVTGELAFTVRHVTECFLKGRLYFQTLSKVSNSLHLLRIVANGNTRIVKMTQQHAQKTRCHLGL